MVNTELVQVIIDMFSAYFVYLMPVFGVMAGLNLIVKWFYGIMFKPFNRLGE